MTMPLTAILLALLSAAPAVTLPPEVDEAAFRAALRERGLHDWLEQHLADTPPADEADGVLRERERLLSLTDSIPGQRAEHTQRAAELLESLIAQHPQDARVLGWRLERSRDLLERVQPETFDHLLLYELRGRFLERARTLTAAAQRELGALREGVASAWRSLESLDEAALAAMRHATPVQRLEEIDRTSHLLLAWVRLYDVLAESDLERRRTQAGLLLETVQASGWAERGTASEAARCGALMVATMSARVAGQFEQADGFAREIVGLLRSAAPKDSGMRQASLIAVLEQVRILRDSGRLPEALTAVRQAAAWVERTRSADLPARIAIALLECSILERQQHPTTMPAFGVRLRPGGLQPLAALAQGDSATRDELYRALAGLSVEPDQLSDDLLLQLWSGAVIDEAQRDPAGLAALRESMKEVARRLGQRIESAGDAPAEGILPELAFLYGRALCVREDDAGAIGAFSRVATRWPLHVRASAAAQAAVAVARDWLAEAGTAERPAAREAFIQSVRIWRDRSPDAPGVRQMQFFLAAELEQRGAHADAAAEYLRVAVSDANYARSMVGRARCLRALLPGMPAVSSTRPATQPAGLAEAMEASRAALSAALSTRPPDACLAAGAAVGMAALANDPRANRPADAITALQQAALAIQDCGQWLSGALHERMEALRRLERWEELVTTFDQFAGQDSGNAQRVGQILLESMRLAATRALDTGDDEALRSAAGRGAVLAEALLEERMAPPAGSTAKVELELKRAWLLVHAGRPEAALPVYDRCRALLSGTADIALALRCDLARAECLSAQSRAAAAASLYSELLGRVPEHSAEWWEAYVGALRCQQQLKADAGELMKSIQQQRRVFPDLGGPRWRREIEHLERLITGGVSTPARSVATENQ